MNWGEDVGFQLYAAAAILLALVPFVAAWWPRRDDTERDAEE